MHPIVKRIVSIVIAVFLLGYVGYQAYLMFYSSVELETIQSHTVYETLDVQGVAIRDEKLISEATDGYVYYEITNGDRVAKGGTIAKVYSSESVALVQQQIGRLDSEIEALETLQLQSSAGRTDLQSINKQLDLLQKEILAYVRAGEMTEAAACREELQQLLNRKQMVIDKSADFSPRLTTLKGERASLASQLEASQKHIASPAAGYFVSAADGYENTFTYESVDQITVSEVASALDGTTPPAAADANCIGKVVGDYVWYLACIVPQEKLSLISEGQHFDIRLPFVTDEQVQVTVKKVNTDVRTGQAVVVLECSYMSEELSSVRFEEVRILLKEYTGLYVPDRALHFGKDNESGVYVRVGNVLSFRYIRVMYYDETGHFSICEANVEQEEGDTRKYLSLYDDVVVEGKGLYDGKVVT